MKCVVSSLFAVFLPLLLIIDRGQLVDAGGMYSIIVSILSRNFRDLLLL